MRGRGRVGAPFCYQRLSDMEAIRVEFTGQRRSTAIAIYQAITELANERENRNPRKRGFRAERKEVAELAGCGTSTLDRYLSGLEAAGVLAVHRADGEAHEWEIDLAHDEEGGLTHSDEGGSPPRVTHPAHSEQGSLPGYAGPRRKPEKEKSSPPARAREDDPREPKSVDSKPVTPEEHDLCDDILAAFNRRAGSDFRSAEYRRGIIGRIRERPDMDLDAHVALIGRTFDHPWWKDGNPSPAVIYGKSATFERCLNEKPDPFQRHDLSAYDRGLEDDP